MSAEKREGAEQKCSKCDTDLICVKIFKEWNGKKEEKLQWQNKEDGRPHFRFAGNNNYSCNPPGQAEPATHNNATSNEPTNAPQAINFAFPKETLERIDAELDKLFAIESIVTKRLSKSDPSPNPVKVGMYMKFLYDGLEIKIPRGTQRQTSDPERYCSCDTPIPNAITNGKTCQNCLKILEDP